jgi:hypothetical protein
VPFAEPLIGALLNLSVDFPTDTGYGPHVDFLPATGTDGPAGLTSADCTVAVM